MKRIIKNMLLLLAAASVTAACTKDDTADVQGITGKYVYIVGGTQAMFYATECQVFQTPDGNEGTVAMDIEVALTKEQNQAVTVDLIYDEEMVADSYSAVPESILNYQKSVTIPAGQTSATTPVTIALNDFSKLNGGAAPDPIEYMAPFRISGISGINGGELEISSNSNAAYLIVHSYLVDPAQNEITLANASSSFTITHYTDQTRGESISQRINITGSASEGAYKEFQITLAVDNSLVDAYNEANGTDYLPLPAGIEVNGLSATMATNGKSASTTVSIPDSAWEQLTDANGYLVPIVLSDVGRQTISANSGVAYIIIKVVRIEGSANFFSALYLGDYRMATWYQFAKPIDCGWDDGYTIVMHIFIDEVTNTARIGDWADINENWINMLRFGQYGQGNTVLDWFVGPNGARKNVRTKGNLPVNEWIQLAFVYDNGMYGETPGYYIYVNGELDNMLELSDADQAAIANSGNPTFQFQAIEFNSSWGAGYRQGNEFHGRLWQVGVFPTVYSYYLSAKNKPYDYLTRENIDYYAPLIIQQWLGGQGAYWSMNEGTGYVLKEKSGRYEDIDFSKTVRCDDEVNMVPADVSPYVQWKNDEHNQFE